MNTGVKIFIGFLVVAIIVILILYFYTDIFKEKVSPSPAPKPAPSPAPKTAPSPAPKTAPSPAPAQITYSNTCVSGKTAFTECNNNIVSENNRCKLKTQTDGNLVLYDNDAPIWSSGTYNRGNAPYKTLMQQDGNYVLYDVSLVPLWASGTFNRGYAPYTLNLTNNCNIIVTDASGTELWRGIKNRFVKVRGKESNKCIYASNTSPFYGHTDCTNNNTLFTQEYLDNSYNKFKLINNSSGKCMYSVKTDSRDAIGSSDCVTGLNEQEFTFENEKIKGVQSNKCMFSSSTGGFLRADCSDTDLTQKFEFVAT